jgi:hypothetical protein
MEMKRKEELKPIYDILETPHKSFCEACHKSDERKVKDTLNLTVAVIVAVATALEIEENSFIKKCKELQKWAEEQQKKKLLILKKKKVKK